MLRTFTRAESNRRNALRSTGPKSAAGKARSSRNALQHGLAAETLCPPDESPEVITARSNAMAAALKPRDATERQMSDRAAFLAMRLDRTAAAETLRTSERIRRAIDDYDESLRADVKAIAATFPRDPAGALRKLKRTSLGIDHLIDRWQEIRELLANGVDLIPTDHVELAHLLGRFPEASCTPPILMMARGAIHGDFADHPDLALTERQRNATIISSRHKLDPLIEAQVTHLEAHRLTLPLTQAEQDRREAPLRAVVDLSHQGTLLRRYETAAAREIAQDLRLLRWRSARRLPREKLTQVLIQTSLQGGWLRSVIRKIASANA